MSDDKLLDRKAMTSASQYIGHIGWPTIALGLVIPTCYTSVVILTFAHILPLWLAMPAIALLTYLAYTVLHESAHSSICGGHSSYRWLNELLGYLAGWILMIPLTAHRHEHLAHHRHTNDELNDPDFHVGQMNKSFSIAVHAALRITLVQFSYYFNYRWNKASSKQNLIYCAEIAVALAPRFGVLLTGYWLEGLALFVVAWLTGAVVLIYLFAYVVHKPNDQQGRYLDTSTILAKSPFQTPVTWLWMFQNYHSIHHLFPRVPFYQYRKLYEEIADVMEAKGAPVYHLTLSGLQPK